MYDFRDLKAEYQVDTNVCTPDGKRSSYKGNIYLTAKYMVTDDEYMFTIEQKKDILLNDAKPSKLADCLMVRLGCSLFPISLNVLPQGKIRTVEMFDEIKARWTEESQKILQEMPSVPVKRYIGLSGKNMKNEKTFLQALMRDTFFMLYFLDNTKNEILFPVYSLMGAGSLLNLSCIKNQIDEHTVSYDYEDVEEETSFRIIYRFSSFKHIISIKAVVLTKGEYKKEINIRLNENSCEIKKTNKFVSNLIYFTG